MLWVGAVARCSRGARGARRRAARARAALGVRARRAGLRHGADRRLRRRHPRRLRLQHVPADERPRGAARDLHARAVVEELLLQHGHGAVRPPAARLAARRSLVPLALVEAARDRRPAVARARGRPPAARAARGADRARHRDAAARRAAAARRRAPGRRGAAVRRGAQRRARAAVTLHAPGAGPASGLMRVKAAPAPAASNNGAMPQPGIVTTVARRPPMARDLTLDVRGMEPPEPLERVLETIGDFAPGDRLKLIIDCEPRPLFRILDTQRLRARDGAGHGLAARDHDLAEVTGAPSGAHQSAPATARRVPAQRRGTEPRQRRLQPHHLADDDQRRRREARVPRAPGKVGERAGDHALARRRRLLDHRRGRRRGQPVRDELAAEDRQPEQSHVDTTVCRGRASAGQSRFIVPSLRWPVTKVTACAWSRWVSGMPAYAATPVAGGDARHDLEGDAVRGERLRPPRRRGRTRTGRRP